VKVCERRADETVTSARSLNEAHKQCTGREMGWHKGGTREGQGRDKGVTREGEGRAFLNIQSSF
jgi:hypothetical protein